MQNHEVLRVDLHTCTKDGGWTKWAVLLVDNKTFLLQFNKLLSMLPEVECCFDIKF